MHGDGGLAVKVAYHGRSLLPETWPGLAKNGQNFGEHFVRRNQVASGQRSADGHGCLMPLVFPVSDRHPIEGIGKYSPHSDGGRFGVP